MATRYSILPSLSEDRVYQAEDFLARPSRDHLAGEGDGVSREIGNSLAVTETGPASLGVDVDTGACRADGWRFEVHTAAETVSLDAADPTNDRIDRIVVRVRLGSSNRDIILDSVTGTPAGSPSAPALTRTADTYEISLAQVYVAASVSSVSNANITDERGDNSVCGYLRAQDAELLRGQSPDDLGASILSTKSTNYTLQAADVGGIVDVPIDISSNGVDIKELALGNMSGVVRYTITNDDGAGSTYRARVIDNGSSEVWTGCREGDSIEIAYDGTSRHIVREKDSFWVDLYLPSNESVAAGASEQITGWTARQDSGGLWDGVTNFDVTAPYDGLVYIYPYIVCFKDNHAYEFKINSAYVADQAAAGASNDDARASSAGPLVRSVSAGDQIEIWAFNQKNTSGEVLNGDAAGDECQVFMRFERVRS